MPPRSIAVVVYDGFDELDAVGPYEVFANLDRVGIEVDVSLVTLASPTPPAQVTGANGLTVVPDGTLVPTEVDLLVVPGGGWTDGGNTGARAAADAGDIPEAMARAAAAGATVATVCTGGMVAASAGLVEGRPATTHHGATDDLREAGADLVDARVVDDGDLVTAGGVTAGIDLAFWLVEREWGVEAVETIAEFMEYEPSEDVHVAGEG